MSHSQADKPETALGRLSQDILFFTFFYLYLWLYVDLRLIYHGAGVITNFPVFYRGWSFFLPFLSYPGGPVEYLSAFLSQLFFYSWAGALVVTVPVWLICRCIDVMLKATNAAQVRGIRFLPPIVLLVLYTQYTYHFATTMAFLAALMTICIYLKATLSRPKHLHCVVVFLLLSVILYYLSGGAFLLFAVVCALYELIIRFRWNLSVLYVLSAAAIPYILGLLIFQVSFPDAFSNLLPFSWKILKYDARQRGVTIVYVLYLLPILFLLTIGLWQLLRKKHRSAKKPTGRKSGKEHRKTILNLPARVLSRFGRSAKLRYVTALLLLFAITGSAVVFSRDEKMRTRFKVDYYAFHKMWPELLASAQHHPNNPLIVHAVNRALYHTGRLGDEMFSWSQHPDYLFLSDEKYQWMYWQIFDVFLDLGVVNMAEHALVECLEGLGSRPMILQRLVLINIVKGNTDSAKIYLGALRKTLFHGGWAKQYLERLRTDPNLSEDPYIQHVRSLCLEEDCPLFNLYGERTLSWLLEKNSQNRMAFEYLMATYMLKRHLGKLVRKIELMPDLGYAELPTHYEEAIHIYTLATRKPLTVSEYQPKPQIRGQIEDFSRILNAYGNNKQAALNDLSKKYRDTYFFYYMYPPKGLN